MTVSIAAKFYQHAPGATLQAQSTDTFTSSAEWFNESSDGFGVKATNTPPTNVSEFGGHVYESGAATMDRLVNTARYVSAPGDTIINATISLQFQKAIALDANWAVGKYVFAYSLGSAGAVVKASPAYRIR